MTARVGSSTYRRLVPHFLPACDELMICPDAHRRTTSSRRFIYNKSVMFDVPLIIITLETPLYYCTHIHTNTASLTHNLSGSKARDVPHLLIHRCTCQAKG